MNFIQNLKNTQNNQYSRTENGALGYASTGKHLLDLNFQVASLRDASEKTIMDQFIKAYYEDKKLAIKWLFFARDVRQGLGERKLFRTVFTYLAKNHPDLPMIDLIALIPEYGRYDDLLELWDTPFQSVVIHQIKVQLQEDNANMKEGKPISLLAKWLPSANTSSEITREKAKNMIHALGTTEKEYRQMLSAMRAYLDVVECKMSAQKFDEINYSAVPSKANLIYRHSFLRHDEQRRTEYLEKLQTGEAEINAQVLFPHEIVRAYTTDIPWWQSVKEYDETLEQLWMALGDIAPNLGSSIVVADSSGSMLTPVGDGTCTALTICNALAIYFAERCSGVFKNHYISFSEKPQLIDLNSAQNLREKIELTLSHNEVANTDMARVFHLILQTAINKQMTQKDLPQNVIIISDMEFDDCVFNANETLFKQIADEYERHGYQLPRLVFWNLNSRSKTIPVKENALGVALVSGFSAQILKVILSGDLDPYKLLLHTLNDERYQTIEEIMNKATHL